MGRDRAEPASETSVGSTTKTQNASKVAALTSFRMSTEYTAAASPGATLPRARSRIWPPAAAASQTM